MPFVSGATIGFTLLILFIGFGFIQILDLYPSFLQYLTIAGSSFIIYMGYKVAISAPDLPINKNDKSDKKNPTFFEGFLLQWLNPKAWIAAVSGVSLFSSVESDSALLTFVFCYFWVCYASLTLWAILGNKATIVLNSQFRLKVFNLIMGGMLILTACYLLYVQLS
jgi:threonine/homoserine/homoserine lactone efflux protein